MTALILLALALSAPAAILSAIVATAVTGRRCRIRAQAAQAAAFASRQGLESARTLLARHQALYHIVTEDASWVVVGSDATHQPVWISERAAAVLGLDPAALLSDAAASLVHADDLEGLRAALSACSAGQPKGTIICRAQQTDGRMIWLELRWRRVPEDGGTLILIRDVSREKLREEHLADALERLERLALHDQLTGLLNRAGFLAAVDRMLANSQSLAVLFVNLDRFKRLNDAHGHSIGDSVLRETGCRLARLLGQDGTMARLSGDEFAVLLPTDDTDVAVAAQARDVLRVLSEPIRIANMTLNVGATIGIAGSPRDGRTAAALLRAADIALAYGKSAGGNCYRFFEARMGAALEAEAQLKHELRSAVMAGEVQPWFQPLIRLKDLSLAGFEVLARWAHPTRGIVAPNVFLPLVDELGLSTDMFIAQMSSVCETTKAWPPTIRLSMNLSPRELQNEMLPDLVKAILTRTGFEGTRLEVEITEEALINDSTTARGVLDGLRALGMTVSLDDFGTGYSSLYHLRELPFDKVKIDKSFMQALDNNAESARYVAAIIGLCHSLGLEMTAEGIEDEATMALVREMGCTFGQGYLFGRAVPASEATRMLEANVWPALGAE